MPWETRKGKGRYYTHSTRVDGKVVRTYIGKGERAEKIADAVEYRKAARKALVEEQRAPDHIDRIVDHLDDAVDSIFRQTLVDAGYHQHQRGEWRKRRGNDQSDPSNIAG